MFWLETLKLDTENTRDSEAATDPTSSAAGISESLTQQGDKSAKRWRTDFCHFCHPVTLRISKVVFPGKSAERRVMRQKRDHG
jgi:hypothetical protein